MKHLQCNVALRVFFCYNLYQGSEQTRKEIKMGNSFYTFNNLFVVFDKEKDHSKIDKTVLDLIKCGVISNKPLDYDLES